jgi:hypothetical protein
LDLSLGEDDTAAIDPIMHRIRPIIVMDNVRYGMGLYMFTGHTEVLFPQTKLGSETLVDLMFILDQSLSETYSARVLDISENPFDTPVITAIFQLITEVGLLTVLQESPYTASGTWTLGTSRARVVEDLCVVGDYFSPWIGNDEKFHAIRSFDPKLSVPTFNLDVGNQVFANSISRTNDLLDAPNRIIVISNGVNDQTVEGPVIGQYDIPYPAPHSIPNRGFVIPDVRTLDVVSADQAESAAKNIGIQQTIYERTTLATAIDPRHDSYDVVYWRGENWLELGWTMELAAGGKMTHTLRKTYES